MALEEFERECKKHGLTLFIRENWNPKQTRCKKCRTEAVSRKRRRIKQKLVESLGGKCVRCGYSKCYAALDFHHRNPEEKSFSLSHGGYTRAYSKALEEAQKCELVCANCHREIENNII